MRDKIFMISLFPCSAIKDNGGRCHNNLNKLKKFIDAYTLCGCAMMRKSPYKNFKYGNTGLEQILKQATMST